MGPAELPDSENRSGSTIRIDQVKLAADQYAVYFHCEPDLVGTFRELYRDCALKATARSCSMREEPAEAALRHCVALALTYHLRRRKQASAK